MILQVNNLQKSFGTTKAVAGVSFSVAQGENLAIIGESGCGKSTLAKLIMGLLRLDSGDIQVNRNKVQMVFQDPYSSLDPMWNIRSILKEAIHKQQLNIQTQEQTMVAGLEAVGLSADMLNRFPHEFSGGERQRIAIARSLLCKPDILILDEAVSSLDVLVQRQIIELLIQLKFKFNLTYIFISHNLKIVKNFSDRIAVMQNGKFIESGTIDDIFNKPKELYTKTLIKAAFEYSI